MIAENIAHAVGAILVTLGFAAIHLGGVASVWYALIACGLYWLTFREHS